MKFSNFLNIKSFSSKKKWQIGASLVEYGLLVALIAVVTIPAVQNVGWKNACKNAHAAAALGFVETTPGNSWTCFGKCCSNWGTFAALNTALRSVCTITFNQAIMYRTTCFN